MDIAGISLVALLNIMLINIVLSGDNAVVIALACRNLPAHQRRIGILLGTGVAVVLRIIFLVLIQYLTNVPFLKIVGALLLLWIAVKLITQDDDAHGEIAASDELWRAVQTVAIADAVMSLDNVLAIWAVAKGDLTLAIIGVALSIPIIVIGASLITTLIKRFPVVIWLGAALLGWVAGEMLVDDRVVLQALSGNTSFVAGTPVDAQHPLGLAPTGLMHYGAAAIGAVLVVAMGYLLRKKHVHTPLSDIQAHKG